MRIVLVEPSRAVQRIMTEFVAPDEHDVLTFSEGKKALECIATDDSVRALITSVQLADISGLQLCAEVRKLAGLRRALFIFIMSSTEDYSLVVQALDNGADDFIRKPPLAEELRARLRAADRLTMLQRELIKYATTDSLTGLLNRRAFFDQATEACRAAEAGTPLSAIMIDIDHFKNVNDTHGHQAGDLVLVGLSGLIRTAAGIVGRLGGEEFCLLEHCELADAVDIAKDLRRSINSGRLLPGEGCGITCSFGVAEWEPGDTIDRLLRRADVALYEAKRTGRDRIVASDTFALTDRHQAVRGSTRLATRSSE
jgi:diguanylate cyclase (GGDEF)-like protein